MQVTAVGSSDNVVFITQDVTDSPCASTNQYNRFQIDNEEKQAAVMMALGTNKPVTNYTSGTCNGLGIEKARAVVVSP